VTHNPGFKITGCFKVEYLADDATVFNCTLKHSYSSLGALPKTCKTRNSADADKPVWRVYRSVKVTKHSTIPYIRYSFLLCNSNFVFQTRLFYDIRLQKISWPWNRGQRSLNVIESGNIR